MTPILDEILQPLPLAEIVADHASEEPAAEEDRTFNAGRPTFRLRTSRQPIYAFWGALAFAIVGALLSTIMVAAPSRAA